MAVGTNVGDVFFNLHLKGQNNFRKAISNTAVSSQKSMGGAMRAIGGFVAKAFAIGTVIAFSKASLTAASMSQSAWTGLNSIIKGQGRSFKEAEGFIKDYVSDGLVPLNNAVGAYKNLALRGYDTSQIEGIMKAFKDSAAFSRQSSYTMGEAIQTATEGLKNENSVIVDNVGVTKNVAKMWDEYAQSIGTTANRLTLAQKRQAEVNGILAETKFQMGDAKAYTETYAGRVAQLSSAFMNLKIAVGSVIAPIVSAFIPALTMAMNAVTKFFNFIGQILSVFGIKFPSVIQKGGVGTMNKLGASAGNAGKQLGGVGKQATKTAKEVKRAFASVDDLNIVNIPDKSPKSSDTGGAGAGGGGGSGVETKMPTGKFELPELPNISDAISPQAKKIAETIKRFIKPLKEIDFKPFINGLKEVYKAMKPITKTLFKGFEWAWFNLFVPMSKWTFEKGLPAFLKVLTGALKVLNPILKIFGKAAVYLWDSFLKPIAKWTGGVVVKVLNGIGKALSFIGDKVLGIKSVQNALATLLRDIAVFAATYKATIFAITVGSKALTALKGLYGNLQLQLALFKMEMASTAGASSKLSIASQIFVGIAQALTGKIKLATVAQNIWNNTIKAHPIVFIAAAVAGLVTGIVKLTDALINGSKAEKAAAEASKEALQVQQERLNNLNDYNAQLKEKADADMFEINRTAQLAGELKKLTDEKGNIQAKDEERVKFILGELNGALGTHYKLNGNQISQYQELTNKVDKYIERQRTEIYLEVEKERVKNALINIGKAQQEEIETRRALEEAQEAASKKNNKANRERLENAQKAYETAKEVYRKYNEDIRTYDKMSQAAFEGNHNKVMELFEKRGTEIQKLENLTEKSEKEKVDILKKQYNESAKDLDLYLRNYKNKVVGYNEEGLRLALEHANKSKEEYKKVGKNVGDGFKEGVDSKKNKTKKTVKDLMELSIEEANKTLDIHSPSKVFSGIGENTIQGYINGAENKRSSLRQKMKSIFSGAIEGAKKILGIHSPSKIFKEIGDYTVAGFQEGLEDGEKDINKKVSNMLDFRNAKAKIVKFSDIIKPLNNLKNPEIKDISKYEVNIADDIKNSIKTLEKAVNELQFKAIESNLNLKVEYEDGKTIIKKINNEQLRAGEVLINV